MSYSRLCEGEAERAVGLSFRFSPSFRSEVLKISTSGIYSGRRDRGISEEWGEILGVIGGDLWPL